MQRTTDGTPEYLLSTEKWLAGSSLLAMREAVIAVGRIVTGERFYLRACGQVFDAALALASAGTEPTIATVAELLEISGTLDDVGGEPGLVRLSADQFAWFYCGESAMSAHAKIVAEYANRRRIIREATEAVQAANKGDTKRGRAIVNKLRPGFLGGVSVEFSE